MDVSGGSLLASSLPSHSARRGPRPASPVGHSRGGHPASENAQKKVETVGQLLDRYLTDYAPAESKWTAEVKRILKKDVRPAIGGHKITAVTKVDILAILNAVRGSRGRGDLKPDSRSGEESLQLGCQRGLSQGQPGSGHWPKSSLALVWRITPAG
jgi:hypothetical protein